MIEDDPIAQELIELNLNSINQVNETDNLSGAIRVLEEYLLNNFDLFKPRKLPIWTKSNARLIANNCLCTLVYKLAQNSNILTKISISIGKDLFRSAGIDPDPKNPTRDLLRVGVYSIIAVTKALPDYLSIVKESTVSKTKASAKGSGYTKQDRYLLKFGAPLELLISNYIEDYKLHLAPMVSRPRDWTSPFKGGYLTDPMTAKSPIIRGLMDSDEDLYDIEKIPEVYKWINNVQSAPWEVDYEMLEIVQKCIDLKLPIKKFPFQSMPELQKYPLGENKKKADFTEEDKLILREWYLVNKKIKKSLDTIKGRRLSLSMAVKLANKYSEHDSIYFPHNLDYRGRIYPITVILNPQGSDSVKSLLKMKHGEPINSEKAMYWFKCHIASLAGRDKDSYHDRFAWFNDNEDIIIECGEKTIKTDRWFNMDKPFQFLQACIDYCGYLKDNNHPISTVIAMDGSCSGLQHYSAMLRDPVGGRSVNLTPQAKPADVYRDVAEATENAIRLKGQTDMSRKWLDIGINRSSVKRSVMTLPYSLTKYTCTEYLEDYLLELNNSNVDNVLDMARYLSDILWPIIGTTLKGAVMAMDWLKECVSIFCKEADLQEAIEWVTPLGFIIRHVEYKSFKKRLDVSMPNSKRYRLNYFITDDTQYNEKKMKSSISPNFVHSMDATHLCLMVNDVFEKGIKDICVIHDSVSVHPNHADDMYTSIRSTFCDLYGDNNVLMNFKSHMEDKYGITLPEPPSDESFTLDLNLVKESEYFFG